LNRDCSCFESIQFCWRDEKLEKDVDFIQTIVKAVRSERGDKNLVNKIKVDGEYHGYRLSCKLLKF
jgi:hypothetical protein